MSFKELPVFSPVPGASRYRCEKYKGCFGIESGVNLFSNMNTTDDMSGLLFGLSCTHKSREGMCPPDQLPYHLAISSTPEPMKLI